MRVLPFSYLKQLDGDIVYDVDAQAFFDAAGITDVTQKNAVNQLVLDLKADSLWEKGIALYPFVGGTSSTHSYNLIDPTKYQLIYFGGITHSSTGIQGNGINGYYDTNLPMIDITYNDYSLGVYCRQNTLSGVDIGLTNGSVSPPGGLQTSLRNASGNHTNRTYNDIISSTTSPNSAVFGGNLRTNASETTLFLNKAKTLITAAAAQIINTDTFYGFAINANGNPLAYSNREQGLAWFGLGLTDVELDNLVDINQTYQTALSRFV